MFRILLGSVLFAAVGLAHSAGSEMVQDPGFKLGGRSAVELSADWWKWAMSSPAEINPVRDMSGAQCGTGQKGAVWFLAGGFGSSKIKRSCTIPAGKHIFFPVINMAYWPREENNGFTCDQAMKNAAMNNDTALDLFVELDGAAVTEPKKYRARTRKCFDIFERVPKSQMPFNAYPSASDGYWILLKPLKPGKHLLKFGGRYNTTSTDYGRMVQDIEYEISVN